MTATTPTATTAPMATTATSAPAIPAGYWQDQHGNLVPDAKVKDIDKLRHQVVTDLCAMAKERSRALGLRRLAIHDAAWQQAMQAIADSMQTASTKPYIRFYERCDKTGEYLPISLDVAAV